MIRRILHRWPYGLLTVLLMLVVVAPGRSDEKSDIAAIEKQIAELQKKLEEAKKGATTSPSLDPSKMAEFVSLGNEWRNVGPANMGGRITSMAVYEADPAIFYIATASGGLLKTVNNGITFTHQFDKQATVSIGDVAVCQSNPDLVWVGTGEGNPRNSVSYGDGVYKSTDGGKTWTNMGLKKSFSTGKILIHPKTPDVVYVGTLGRLYGPGGDRGVFKTEDGGKTWKNVLKIDEKTGIIDMVMDPTDPNTIIAAGWERKRDEFDGFFGEAPVPDSYGPIVTHGPGGGLWKTSDGGKTWKKLNDPALKNGLPTVKTGRIGLDYSRKTKGLIFALIDTEKVGTGDPPRQVYMGIVGESVPDDGGAKLQDITANSPAEKGGLKADDVIVAVDGKKITTYEALVDVINTKKAGDKLKLTVKRGDKEMDLVVTLENRPTQQGRSRQTTPPVRAILGFTFEPNAKTAKIGTVTPEAPAAQAGIKDGDEIVAVDAKAVKTAEEYQAAIGQNRKPGDVVKLTILRGTEKKEFTVTFAASGSVGTTRTATILMPGFVPDFGNREAVKVLSVVKGSDAEKAGMKEGAIIVAIDEKPVTSTRDLITALRVGPREDSPRKAGDKVKVKFKQGEKESTADLALVETPAPRSGGGGVARGPSATKPYLLGLGGQQPNAQDSQGKDGVQTGGLYRSTDNGETWTRVNSLNPRPMYFSVVRVDPTDDKILYVLGDVPVMWKSTDGGTTFKNGPGKGVHADAHALWINPKSGKHLIIGCDGGFYLTFDAGENWEHLNHFALGQFYHVAVDNRRPYNIYGGLQDNGSWGGPSQTIRSYGPVNEDWIYVNGGDGFVCRIDPTDPDLVYSESQGGAMNRRNFRTGERGFIRPPSRQNDPPHRFNWNTPFILSSHNPSIFYCAGEYVWRSVKKGVDLRKISPEITRTKAGSGTALSESPMNPEVVWAGSDDGFVWVTRDGGTNWTNVTENILKAGLPGHRWVATLEASRDTQGRCYVCFDAHRSDDDKPYLFVTEDFGATWKPITSNLPEFGSTRCLREDIKNQNLLYCGTEFGAYASMDRGKSWLKLGQGLPTVAVHEFAQPTVANEIVAATHGRSIWILDITSLRQMTDKISKTEPTLFVPDVATRWRSRSGSESPYSSTDKKFVGTNPSTSGKIEYLLPKDVKELSVKVFDVSGKTIANFNRPLKTTGFHRINWTLAGRSGVVKPGAYRVVLTVDGKEYTQPIVVELDPNAPKDLVTIDGEEVVPETPVNPLKPVKVPAIIDN